MKNKLIGITGGIILCFLLVSLALAQGLWDIKKSRTSTMVIDDLFMVNENVGWVISGNGIFKTTDGCVSFFEQTNPSTKILSKIYFQNTNTGFIFGDSALCLKTTNGGSSWSEISLPVPDSLTFSSVYFLNDTLGWIGLNKSSFHACVIKTTDGGNTWNYYGMVDSLKQKEGPPIVGWGYIGPPWVVFWTPDSGAVAAGVGVTSIYGYYTRDGGQTWSAATITAASAEKFRPSSNLARTGSTSARSFALRGAMLKTTDRGVNWVSDGTWWNRSNMFPAVRDVETVNDSVGYYSVRVTLAYGWNQIGRTTTGWAGFDSTQYVYTGMGTSAVSLSFVSEEVGFAVLYGRPGDNFIIKTTDRGSTWAPVDPNAWPGWAFNGLYVSGDNAVAIGMMSAPSKSTDGGDTWTLPSGLNRVKPPELPYINSSDISGIDARAGVIVGATGYSWQNRSTDGGDSWASITCPGTSVNHNCVAFADDNIVVAGAGSGKMSRSTNAGASWTSLTTIARLGFIYGIAFKTSTDGYCIGNNGVIYYSTDAGATWSYRDSIYKATYNDLVFVTPNFGYTVGYRGYLGKTTDGGTNWDLVDSLGYDFGTSTYGPTCYTIEFKDTLEGWIGAADGVVYHTYNGGSTWTKEPAIITPLGDNPTINAMAYTSGSCQLLATGSLGFIGKYQSNAPYLTKQYYALLLIPANVGYTLNFWVTAWDADALDVLQVTKSGVGSWSHSPGVSPATGNYSWAPVMADASLTPYTVDFTTNDCWGSSGTIAQQIRVFVHGDANQDNKISVSDVVYLINYLFKGGPAPTILMSGDANGDTPGTCIPKVSVSDVVYLINYLFKGGPVPVINTNCLPLIM